MTGVILLTGSLVTGTGMEVGKGVVRGRRRDTGTVQGGDMEALLLDEEGALVVGEKEARRGGQGLSNGTENGRRRKREEEHKKNITAAMWWILLSASLRLLMYSEVGKI